MSVLGKRPMPTKADPGKGAPFSSYPLIKPAGSSVSQPAKLQKVAASDGVARGIRMEPVWRGIDNQTPMLNSKFHWAPQSNLELKLPSGSRVVFKDDEGSSFEWHADSKTVMLVSTRRWHASDIMTQRSLGLFSALFIKSATPQEVSSDNGSTHDMLGLSIHNWRLRRDIAAKFDAGDFTQGEIGRTDIENSILISQRVVAWYQGTWSLWGTLRTVKLHAGSENRGRPLVGTVVDGRTMVLNYWMSDALQNGDHVGFAFVRRPKNTQSGNEYRDIVRALMRMNETTLPSGWNQPRRATEGDTRIRFANESKEAHTGVIQARKGALFGIRIGRQPKMYWLRRVDRGPLGGRLVEDDRELPVAVDNNGHITVDNIDVEPDKFQRDDRGNMLFGAAFEEKRRLLRRKDQLDEDSMANGLHDWLVEPWSCRSAAGPGDNFAAGLGWRGHIMRLGRVADGAGQLQVGAASHLSLFSGAQISKTGTGGPDRTAQRAIFPHEEDLDSFDKDIQHLKHIHVIMHRF